MAEQNFVYVDTNYLKELEETAKKVDYYKGIIDGIMMCKTDQAEQTEHRDCINCESADDCAKCRGFTDELQTDCDGCQHYADKHTADACYECSRSYRDCYAPQTERSE